MPILTLMSVKMKNLRTASMILVICFLMGGCNSESPPSSSTIQFQVNTTSWLENSQKSSKPIDHYGVIVIDVSEMKKNYENLAITPKSPISFPLTKEHTYYILLMAYDNSHRVLTYSEKEIKI